MSLRSAQCTIDPFSERGRPNSRPGGSANFPNSKYESLANQSIRYTLFREWMLCWWLNLKGSIFIGRRTNFRAANVIGELVIGARADLDYVTRPWRKVI